AGSTGSGRAVLSLVESRSQIATTKHLGGRVQQQFFTLGLPDGAWFEKGSGTFVRSTLRAVPAKVPDPFSNQAPTAGSDGRKTFQSARNRSPKLPMHPETGQFRTG